ncbi:hypothetical protein BD769DRAFT_1677796 [Suillus cothurnatus]|nr:hypothetical protein BD769DRAFT_1677796 [Suillus cothurnatus]
MASVLRKPPPSNLRTQKATSFSMNPGDEHLVSPHEEVAMPVCIAHLEVNELGSVAGDVSHDVQQVVKRLPDVQRASEQFLDASNVPPDATFAIHHGKDAVPDLKVQVCYAGEDTLDEARLVLDLHQPAGAILLPTMSLEGLHMFGTIAKLPPKRTLPPRGPGGQFIKVVAHTELSELSASRESSPLDTPEISQRTLDQEVLTESEYEVNQQLAEDEDRDDDSLPGAPEPGITLPIIEPDAPMIPFPHIQPQDKPPIPAIQPLRQLLASSLYKSKSHTQTITIPQQIPFAPMASIPAPSTFEGKESENPQNFLREVERYIYLNHITDEVTKVVIFSMFIYAGSQADLWWNGLDTSKKTTWQDVKKEFENQWPAIVVAAKSQLDYQKELLTLRLKEEDMGEQITVAEVLTWSHLHYHGCLQKLVQDVGVMNTPVFIHQV